MNLKSVIRNSVLKHPVLTSSLVWRKTPFCIINFVLLPDGACCCYFPTCWTQSAVCDWAFRPNSPLFHSLIGEVKLAGLNWLEYFNRPGPNWNPGYGVILHRDVFQKCLQSWTWSVIFYLINFFDCFCIGSDMTLHVHENTFASIPVTSHSLLCCPSVSLW